MSEVKVDKISPKTGTAMTVGDSGDTFTVPSGATLTVAGALNVTGTTSLADGTVAVAELDIDGATDINAAIVDADLFVVDDGAGGTNRKTAASRLKTYILGDNSVDSDAYVDGSIDTSHIGALQVTGAKLNTDVISAQTALGATPADTDELLVSDAGVLKRVDYSYLKGITAANFRPNAKPIIINGNMAVAQRGTSATGVTDAEYSTVDRLNIQMSSIGTYTIIQEALTSGNAFANGFNSAWRIDCTTADASPSTAEYLRLNYRMEGRDLQCFKKGTANAQPYTLAFWVKSNKTGAFQVNLFDLDNTRLVGQDATISSGDTWEHIILNYPADTTGPMTNDNGEGMRIDFNLDAGSNYSSGTMPTTWEASVNANRAVNTLALADNTANDWAITGIQLEVGEYTSSTIPPFQHESYADNLRRCLRYYQANYAEGAYAELAFSGQSYSSNNAQFNSMFLVPMRAEASLGTTGTASNYAVWEAARQTASAVPTVGTHSTNVGQGAGVNGDIINMRVEMQSTGNLTAGRGASLCANNTTAAYLKYDAEL